MPADGQEIAGIFPAYDRLVPVAVIITQALFIIAVAMTFSLYARSRTPTTRQIQASLSHIEEHLKKTADKEQEGAYAGRGRRPRSSLGEALPAARLMTWSLPIYVSEWAVPGMSTQKRPVSESKKRCEYWI